MLKLYFKTDFIADPGTFLWYPAWFFLLSIWFREARLRRFLEWKRHRIKLTHWNAELGFDRPFLVQYVDWFTNVLRGDWGESYFLHQTVTSAIAEYFVPTLSLAVFAQIIALILSIPLGILAAYKRGTALDLTCVTASLLGSALPGFLLSMFLMLFFGVYLHWFPVAGYAALSEGLGEHLRYLFLPALSLGIVQARVSDKNDKIFTSGDSL